MADFKSQAPTQLPKEENVNIKSFTPVIMPTTVGMTQLIWGLGDDNKMYLWDSNKKKWMQG